MTMRISNKVRAIIDKEYKKGKRSPFTRAQWQILREIREVIFAEIDFALDFHLDPVVHVLEKKRVLTKTEIKAARDKLMEVRWGKEQRKKDTSKKDVFEENKQFFDDLNRRFTDQEGDKP